MGADHSLYAATAWRALADAHFLDWPVHHSETTIAAIAGRVVAEARISDGDVIIGSSLGGIVGCEIARTVSLKSLVLIGSAKNKGEISRLLALLRPLAPLAPVEFVQRSAGKYPNEITQMFCRSEATFIRAMCAAIFDWPGLDESRIKPIRIHGRHDRVIPCPEHVDLLLDGRHLLAMTHSEQCVRFIMTIDPH